jgi:hypothetical protein
MHLPSSTLLAFSFAAYSAAIESGSISVLDEGLFETLELKESMAKLHSDGQCP